MSIHNVGHTYRVAATHGASYGNCMLPGLLEHKAISQATALFTERELAQLIGSQYIHARLVENDIRLLLFDQAGQGISKNIKVFIISRTAWQTDIQV